MNDTHTSPTESKPKKLRRIRAHKPNRKLILVVIAVLVVVGAFFAGSTYGANKEKKAHKDSVADSTRPAADSSKRWNSVGTITEVSDTKIVVKDSRDQTKEAKITKDTKIVDRKGTALKPSDLKKDQKVITTGEKDGDSLTVTRIRLQQ